MEKKQCDIAIIGASFAGLSAYLMLRKKLGSEVDIRIFDMRDVFTYTPGLHECLGDADRLHDLQFSLQEVYGDDVIIDQVAHIDAHTLTLASNDTRSFSYAVIATGSKPQFFKNKQREENGYTLRWAEDIPKLNTVLPDASVVTIV